MRWTVYCTLFLLAMTQLTENVEFSCATGYDQYGGFQHDAFLPHSVFRKIDFSSLFECAAECQQSPVCLSINFDLETRTCHLNINNSISGSVVSKKGYIFSDLRYWTKNLSGPCSEVKCSNGTSCRLHSHIGASCVKEYRGCGYPPLVENTNLDYNGIFVGATATYTCKKGFKLCKKNNPRVCQVDGMWNDVLPVCKQSTWHGPMKAFRAWIPCGSTESLKLFVQGTPSADTVFCINFGGEGDILLHVSMRFDDFAMKRQIITNTKISGVWEKEKLISGFPFHVGVEFDLMLELTEGFYRMSVNGNSLFNLQEKHAGRKVDVVEIVKDVSVHVAEIL